MIGATSGADERDSGLASGLVNTSQQLGGALGIAVLVALAARHTDLAGATDRAQALTDGFAAGFTGGAAIAALGAALAAAMFSSGERRRRREVVEGKPPAARAAA